jgi:Fe-S oxidoreductase
MMSMSEALKSNSKLRIIEMEASKEKSLCCGAGGGHFWMDMKVGQRINVIRSDQAAATGTQMVATACPFCLQMMEDGMKLTNREENIQVKDLAELMVERLQHP